MTQVLLCTVLMFHSLASSQSQILCRFYSKTQHVIDFRMMSSDHASSPASIGANLARVHAGLAPATSNDLISSSSISPQFFIPPRPLARNPSFKPPSPHQVSVKGICAHPLATHMDVPFQIQAAYSKFLALNILSASERKFRR